MRPDVLFPLFAEIKTLPGVGPRIAALIELAAGGRVVDLCFHLPTTFIDRSYRPAVCEADRGRIATLEVEVERHIPSAHPRIPYKVRCFDETGYLTLVYFHPRADYLTKLLPEGERRIVSGRLDEYKGEIQITHPDYVVPSNELKQLPLIEPVYPLTAGLTAKKMNHAVQAAVKRAPDLPDWLDSALSEKKAWTRWREALIQVHQPSSLEDLSPTRKERERLAYDELLANQLALALMRRHLKKRSGRTLAGTGNLVKRALDALPYKLTASQNQAMREIDQDMASPSHMTRLLQGDVGSGKTVVALLAMLRAVESGSQSALMAPTEILAQQHYAFIKPLTETLDIPVAILTSRDKGDQRRQILDKVAAGQTKILIGTHALFQEGVHFHDLAFTVIDEQHRFGVHQRLQLTGKGNVAKTLVMTATPIPRTLMLTLYGDLDVSRLTEKPHGRKPIETRVIPLSRLDEVVGAVKRTIMNNNRVYWVCPLIEESEAVDATAAEDRYNALHAILGDDVGLLHGRMTPEEKDGVMANFRSGNLKVLVATTVIEVGVDVLEATVIVIERAERFGLAQLHQLRGRVGRGHTQASCLLLYGSPLSATAKARLSIMRETEDGFRIAEEDLKLRGAGDLLGIKQSGIPQLRLADLEAHRDLLQTARDDAKLIITKDPHLESERGQALRVLLYLFGRDETVRYLRSG